MKTANLALILVAVVALVVGQILQKLAMSPRAGHSAGRPRAIALLVAGIVSMTIWFLLWLGLMQRMPLSQLFPFEGLASVLLSLAAVAILRERTSPRLWIGVGLIAIGVAMVGAS